MTVSEAKHISITNQLTRVLETIRNRAEQGRFTATYHKDLTEENIKILTEELGFDVQQAVFSLDYVISWK